MSKRVSSRPFADGYPGRFLNCFNESPLVEPKDKQALVP